MNKPLIPYQQLLIELDKLILQPNIRTQEQVQAQHDTIEAFLEATGWSWDDIVDQMIKEHSND